jgi:hypothetical protein
MGLRSCGAQIHFCFAQTLAISPHEPGGAGGQSPLRDPRGAEKTGRKQKHAHKILAFRKGRSYPAASLRERELILFLMRSKN